MDTTVRYFRSQNYTAREEISEEQAVAGGTYVQVAFERTHPVHAEIFVQGQLHSVVYYDRDPQNNALVSSHRGRYGAIPMTIYDRPSRTPDGEMQTLSEWNGAGDLIQTTKRLVDERGEPLNEEVFDRHGIPVGVRRFEYEGTYLARIVFTRADGTEIIELED